MTANRAEIIAISNQKGGVGKTSTANALAARLHDLGKAVLVVDMDPQGNLSSSINADYDSGTILDVMRGKMPAKEAVQHKEPFDIIPANILLAGYEQELISSNFGRDIRLKKGIAPLLMEYDYIIIDIAAIDPLKTLTHIITAPKRVVVEVHVIQIANEFPSLTMFIIVEQKPVKLLGFIPFNKLGEFSTHKGKFLARMGDHICHECSEPIKLLVIFTRIFVEQ